MVRFLRSAHFRSVSIQRVLDALRPHRTLFTIAAGFALQWSAVHYCVSRPLSQQVARMESELNSASRQMQQLVAVRGAAQQGHDLLSALEAQQLALAPAEQALADIRRLRMGLEQEARLTGVAAAQLQQLGDLQRQLTAAGDQAHELSAVLERLTQLNQQIDGLAHPAADSLARVAEANRALSQMNLLQSRLAEQDQSLPAALESLEATLNMQSTLAATAPAAQAARQQTDRLVEIVTGLNTVAMPQVDAAAEHATELLALHDMLADAESLRLKEAKGNLQSLLTTQSDLLSATPEIAAAAENLELLTDFQSELSTQMQGLDQVRKELLEVALLRETVTRVAEVVAPLAELSDLRRLDADQVRAMAREILDRRTAQALPIAEIYSTPTESIGPARPLPHPANDELVPAPMDP